MKKTKKAMEGGVALMVTLVGALLVIGLLLILTSKSGKGIDDAAKEMESFKNLYNPTCDTDKDGIANVKDLCPCDSDSSVNSRIYYLQEDTACKAYARHAQNVDTTENPDLGKLVYYINIANNQDPCFQGLINAYASLSKDPATKSKINEICPDLASKEKIADESAVGLDVFSNPATIKGKTGYVFYFYDSCPDSICADSCADKILAMSAEFNRPTFTCKTPTKECKKKVTSSDC